MQEPPITEKQLASIHVYFRALANEFNDHGLSVKAVLNKAPFIDANWNEEMVKQLLAKPLMAVIAPGKRTMRLNTIETQNLYETLNRYSAENFGISMQFPEKDKK